MPATKIWADCSHPLHSSALPAKAWGSWHPGRPGEGLAAAASKGSRDVAKGEPTASGPSEANMYL